MKKHLSLLFLLAAVVGLSAKTIDTKDLTVTAPDTWIAESSDVGYPISSLVTMSNASETEMLVIGVYEVDADLQSFLQQQVVEGSNNFFTNASYVGEIRDEKLGGAPAKAVEFQTDVLGVPHRGTAYAAHELHRLRAACAKRVLQPDPVYAVIHGLCLLPRCAPFPTAQWRLRWRR